MNKWTALVFHLKFTAKNVIKFWQNSHKFWFLSFNWIGPYRFTKDFRHHKPWNFIKKNVFRWLFSQLLALNVSIKNQFSNVPNINYGVLQASIFEPLMFPLYVNLVSTNVPLLYPLKTSENLQFSDVVRGYRSETLVKNGFMISSRLRIAPD